MAAVGARPTEALAHKTARRFAISNFLIMAAILLVFMLVLNIWSFMYSYGHIDARSSYQTRVFIDDHRTAENHTYGLSTSFIPTIYIKTDNNMLLDLHPTDDIPAEDLNVLLERTYPWGDSTARIDGRFYRVHRERVDAKIVEGEEEYHVEELLLLRDITEETTLRNNLSVMSAVTYLVSLVVIAPIGYFMAKRSVVPIRKAWERQRQFTADASHKLKTPLAVMLANIEMVLRHPEHRVAEEKTALEASLSHAYKMRNTLSDLLTLTQVEDSMLEHARGTVDVGDVVEQTYEDMGQLAAKRGVRLKVETHEGALVMGDRDRIEEMVVVFVENAINYTPEGGTVEIECRREGRWAVLTVADAGIGMGPEAVRRVFDRFYREERAREMNPQGSGLGLPIAQWIAERHGGHIDIESEVGKGTTIRVRLPLNNVRNVNR